VYFDARDKARKQAQEDAAPKLIADYIAALQGTGGGAATGGAAAPAAPGVPSLMALGQGMQVKAPASGVHVAKTEADVQRLERATGMVVDPADLDKTIRTAYGEDPNNPAAVAAVIRNRANQSGMTPTQVVHAPGQFEPWSDPAARARMAALDPGSAEYKRIAAAVEPALRGEVDPTGGADHFFAPKAQAALGRPEPEWAKGQPGTDIGPQRYFKLGYGGGAAPQVSQADLPVERGAPAQGFAIPGGAGGAPPSSGSTFTGFGGVGASGANPEALAAAAKLAANPVTRAFGLQEVTRLAGGGQWQLQTVGDNTVLFNARNGQIVAVPGMSKPNVDIREVNGRLVAVDKNKLTSSDITPAGMQPGFRALTDPAERARFGIPTDDRRPYQVGPDGKLATPGGGQTVNVDTKSETAEAGEVGKAAGKALGEMYGAANGAATSLQRYTRLSSLLDQIETGKLTPGRVTVAAWAKAAGVSDEALTKLGLDPKMPGTAQAIQSIINQSVTGSIGAGGMPANNFSDADRNFLVDVFPKISNDPRGNALILETGRRMEQLKLEKAKAFREWKAQPGNKSASFFDFDTEWNQRIAGESVFADLAERAKAIGGGGGGGGASFQGGPLPVGGSANVGGVTIQRVR
jgi:hypothetical protein